MLTQLKGLYIKHSGWLRFIRGARIIYAGQTECQATSSDVLKTNLVTLAMCNNKCTELNSTRGGGWKTRDGG